MAFYLVKAKAYTHKIDDLKNRLHAEEFRDLKPFGKTITHSLKNIRKGEDDWLLWEEEDYCSPPLAQERNAVLDTYFYDLKVEIVSHEKGWNKIKELEPLFPSLTDERLS